jgi:hypothetical protein
VSAFCWCDIYPEWYSAKCVPTLEKTVFAGVW